MATFNLNQARVLVGGYDITAELRQLALNLSSEVLDDTRFTVGGPTLTRGRIAGLKTWTVTAGGYVNLGTSQGDQIIYGKIGGSTDLVSVFGNGIVVGSTAAGSGFGGNVVDSKYTLGDAIGKNLPYSFEAQSASPLLRAVVLNDFSVNALSTGVTTGTAFQLPTVSTCEALYAAFHVLGLSTAFAGQVSAILQAATSSGFSVPTTVVTFNAVSCRQGSYAAPVASNALSTDRTFFRAQITVSTGTSTGAVANGLIWMSLQS